MSSAPSPAWVAFYAEALRLADLARARREANEALQKNERPAAGEAAGGERGIIEHSITAPNNCQG